MLRSCKQFCITILVCVLAIAAVQYFFYEYKKKIDDLHFSRSKAFITEFANSRAMQTHETLSRILLTAQEQAAVLGQFPENELSVRIRLYNASIFEHGCKRLGFLQSDGTLFTASGMRIAWEKQSFMSSILGGRSRLADNEIDPVDGESVNVAATPVYSGGRIVGAFVILFTDQQVHQAFRATSVQSKGPSLLVASNGNVISASVQGLLDTNNIFNAIRQDAMQLEDVTVDTLDEAMRRGQGGFIHCSIRGVGYIMAYSPVQLNNWYVLSLLPISQSYEEAMTYREFEISLHAYNVAVVLLLAFYALGLHMMSMHVKRQDVQRLSALTENIPGGMLRVFNDGIYFQIMDASPGLYAMTGYSKEEFLDRFGENFLEFIHPEDRDKTLRAVQVDLMDKSTSEIEYRVHTKDGRLRWFLGRGRTMGDARTVDCVVLDITEKKQLAEHQLMDAQRYRLLFELSGSIFYEYDCEACQLNIGHGFKEKFGCLPSSSNFPLSLLEDKIVHKQDGDKLMELAEQARSGQSSAEATLRIRKTTGRHVWCHVEQVHVIGARGQLVKVIGKITDVDHQVRAIDRLNRQNQRDAFTRLLNKVSTREVVDSHLSNAGPGECAALCIVDLDRFKTINDTYGHDTGDAVLFQAAKHLRQSFRSTDVIGRIGGDEFLVFFKNLPNMEVLMSKLEKLRGLFRDGCYVEGVDVRLSISVGIALYSAHGTSFGRLYRNADKALYRAKVTRDAVAVYDVEKDA